MGREVWRDVKGFSGYQISNKGYLRSSNRAVYHSSNKQTHLIRGKLLKPRINNCGYVSVRLSKDGKTYTRFIHRLMAEAFIPNPISKQFINHRNGIKTDNRLSNLEWVTHSENMLHAYQKGLIKLPAMNIESKLVFPYERKKAQRLEKKESRN